MKQLKRITNKSIKEAIEWNGNCYDKSIDIINYTYEVMLNGEAIFYGTLDECIGYIVCYVNRDEKILSTLTLFGLIWIEELYSHYEERKVLYKYVVVLDDCTGMFCKLHFV